MQWRQSASNAARQTIGQPGAAGRNVNAPKEHTIMANVQSVQSVEHVKTAAELIAENTGLLARIAALEAAKPKAGGIVFKVSDKKAVSVYGLQRWPVTLYSEQWARLISEIPQLTAFMAAHVSELATKAEK
jgi:hypothetical protein